MIPEFWSLLRENKRNIFWQWDIPIALALGALASGLIYEDESLPSRYQLILATEAGITVALLGVVLAGLALLVSLMNDEMTLIAQQVGRGVIEDYFPFSVAAIVAVLTSILCIGFLIATPPDDVAVIRIGTGVSTAMFAWTLSHVLALVRFVAQQGVIRAKKVAQSRSDK
jgi:hypothetical protein